MIARRKVKIKPGHKYTECCRCGKPVPVFDTIERWEHYGYIKDIGQLCPKCYETICDKYHKEGQLLNG